jgi:hypothetical protein
MCHAADAFCERSFLGLHGERQYQLLTFVDDASHRLEAIATDKVSLDLAQRKLTAAQTDEEEDEAYQAVKRAKQAFREAEALPAARRMDMSDSGQTVAEVWATGGHDERVRMLRAAGRWVVKPGRGVEDKIYLDPTRDHLDPESVESLEGLGGMGELVEAMSQSQA